MATSNKEEVQKEVKSNQALSNKEVPVQRYINQKYPKDGVCKRNSDPENKDKKREDIITLDISQGKIGKGFFNNDGKTLTGFLKLEGFINLKILKCFSQQVTGLDVSECPKLERLDCSSNQITSLDVKNLTELKEINCYDNKITKLDLNDNVKLKTLKCHKNPLKEIIGLEKLSELTFVNSGSFFPIKQLGEDTNKAKKLLIGDNGNGGYKKLMEEQVVAYKRADDSGVFKSGEIGQYQTEIENYQEQIKQIEILTNK